MSRPIFVHLLLLIKKPATGSVTAPEALPMNSTKEAWSGVIWKYRHNTVNKSHCFTIQWNSIKQLSRKDLSVLKNNDRSFTKHVCYHHRNCCWLTVANKWDIETGTMQEGIRGGKCKEGEIMDVFRTRKMSQIVK